MELERISPEKAGISSRQIIKFLDALKKEGLEIHSMMLLRHGKVFAESWWKPYNKNSRHIMFSFTKSLTSTAIGFAEQEGFLSTDDYLLDFFPDKAPENPSENLKKCQLKHLLMMGCGHEQEISMLGIDGKNWIECFMNQPFVYEPGTHFLYNTAGTNMLCAVLKKATGLNLTQFLRPRLFDKIGMGNFPCYTLPDGTEFGGAGSRLTTDEMARFIQFIANRGVWNGERLLNEKWFDKATAKQIDNSATSDIPDWQQGYCFQFWRCVPAEVFRADGAFGQFGVVCPKEDAVFIFTTASTNFHSTLSVLWEHILPQLSDSELPEDRESNLLLKYILGHNEITPMLSTRQPNSQKKYNDKKYSADIDGNWADFIGGAGISPKGSLRNVAPKNGSGKITELTVSFHPYEAVLSAKIGDEYEVLPISMTSHFNSFELSDRVYGAVGAWRTPDTFEFVVHCAEAATGKRFYLTFGEKCLKISTVSTIPDFGGLNDAKDEDLILTEI